MSKRNYQSIDPKWLDKSTPEQIMKKADSDDEDIDLIALFQAQQQRKREKKVALTSSTTKIKKVASFGVGRKEDTNALRQKEHTSKSSSSPQKTMSTSQKELQEPVKKKTKVDASNVQQSSLFNFFSTASTKKTKTTKTSKDKESQSSNVAAKTVSVGTELKKQKESLPTSATDEIPDPIIPKEIPQQRNVAWRSIQDNLVIIRKPINEKARKKVAAFDIDGTLMIWRTASSWPSSLSHYELWASTVPGKLRALYDDGYKLVLISNQGAIQKAHDGKNAKRVKNLIDWISHVIDRPLYAVLSTKTLKKDPYSFHKPTEKMWSIAIDVLNRQRSFNVKESFFVGDSADINDPQGGVDFRFAQNVAQKYGNGTDLTFHTPEEYFGPSDSERRQRSKSLEKSAIPPPKEALAARSALLGGYIRGPILLILCGVQGSGKSTFCNKLVEGKKDYWVHLSQDTINNGKPGKREKVEEEAKAALERGQSTVIDRMHLDEEQRKFFTNVARETNTTAHVLVFNLSRGTISKRVRKREHHPGNVMGENGVRQAMKAFDKLKLPTYEEDIELITCVSSPTRVEWFLRLYRALITKDHNINIKLPKEVPLSETLNINIPTISLGTMGIGKRVAKDVVSSLVSAGITSIDTAPTYKNEENIGEALSTINEIFCIGKVPKSAVKSEHVRSELESSLKKLQRKNVDLLLLHWPCDVIAAGSLATIWREMEQCLSDGLCKALGVCNFNIDALATLLRNCSIKPVVNQVERHPLLPQWDMIDFCERNDIYVQAHTPLCQGKDDLFANSVIEKIANETTMSPAQVAIQWNLQHGCLVTPKCSSKKHARELLSCTNLSPVQMKALDSMARGKRFVAPPFMYGNFGFCWGITRPSKQW